MDLPNLGDVFEGRYELIGLLGEGGFARVFRGRDLTMQRDVAIKVLSPKGGEYSTRVGARFLRECRLIANLQDPHTIRLYDFGQSPSGLLYMVSEFVAGEDLRATLQKKERLSPRVVVHILQQLLEALREAHTQGIFHRDVKPANILIFTRGDDPYCVKLLDFGLARPVDANATQITGAGALVGTPRYMSPEQVFAQDLGPRSDLYSLGLVGYEMLTGAPAVDAPTMKALLQAHVTGPAVVVPESSAPARLRSVIEKMCVRELALRYGSADEVLRDLALARAELRDRTGGTPMASPAPPPVPSPAQEPQPAAEDRRWTLRVVQVAFGLVALIVLAAIWPTTSRDESPSLAPSRDERAATLIRSSPADDAGSRDMIPADDAPRDSIADQDGRPPGCGRAARSGNFSLPERVHRGLVNVRIPTGYAPELPTPVVIALHDTTQPSGDMIHIKRLNALSDEANFVLVAPGDPDMARTWIGIDVVDHIEDALRVVADQVCIDLDRVFIIGHGNGAFGAKRIACEMEGVVAMALTSHRQSDDEPECDRDPVPTLFIASNKDPAFPVDGGRDCLGVDVLWTLAAHEDAMTRRHRCDASTRTYDERLHGRCADAHCEIRLRTCRVSGGRDWATMPRRLATSSKLSPCYSEPMKFDVEGEIVRFFTEEMQRAQSD